MKTRTCFPFPITAAATVVMGILAQGALAAESDWETDYEAAKKKAAEENKDLFVNFTGSDWCHFCIELKKDVFDQDEFVKSAANGFLLVEIDFPDSKEQAEDLKKQNEALRLSFGIEGLPTMFLVDAKGRPFGQIPNQPGITPDQFVAQMSSYQGLRKKRDEHFTKAEKSKGLERAKSLDAGLDALSSEIVDRFYGETIDEIISLDKKDELKRNDGRKFAKAMRDLEGQLADLARAGDHKALESAIDKFIKERKLKKENKQAALMLKLGLYGPDQLDSVVSLLDSIIKLDSKSAHAREAEEIRHRVDQYRKETKAAKEANNSPK